MESRKAAIHSLYIIVFSQSANLLLTLLGGVIPAGLLPLLPTTVLGGALGAAVGRILSKKMGDQSVNRLYIGMLIFVFCISIGNVR